MVLRVIERISLALLLASAASPACEPQAPTTDASAEAPEHRAGAFYPLGGNQFGTCASRPGATGSGKVFFCSDLPVSYFDDPSGSAWRQLVRGLYTPAPSAVGSYTIVGTSNLALSQVGDAIRATMLTGANTLAPVAVQAGSLSSSGTWVVNLVASFDPRPNTSYPEIGPVVTDGTTSGTSNGYTVAQFTSASAFGFHQLNFKINAGRSSVSGEYTGQPVDMVRTRLLADGTNLHYQVSLGEGVQFSDLQCVATPASLADYGFMLGNEFNSNTSWLNAVIYRNDLTTLTMPQVAISSISTATPNVVTTSAGHNLATGDLVAIHGSTNGNFNNGTGMGDPTLNSTYAWVITVTGTTTFTIPASDHTTSSTGGTATLVSR